jgi:hypothetical protein
VLKNSPASSFAPVALFNRFDLVPADGAHCGEYRIVCAMHDGAAGRLARELPPSKFRT